MIMKLNSGESLEFPDTRKKYILAKLIIDAKEKIGHLPSFDEAKAISRMPENLGLYAISFGSFKKACEVALYEVRRFENPEMVSNYGYGRCIVDKREEILNRVVELCFKEHGNHIAWINEKSIKRDPILVFADVIRTFGGIRQLKEAAKERIYREKHHKNDEPQRKSLEETTVTQKEPEKYTSMEVEKMADDRIEAKVEDNIKVENENSQAEQQTQRSYKRWTQEEIIEILYKYYDENKKLPTDLWLSTTDGVPHVQTVKSFLGPRSDWLKAIGVEAGLGVESATEVQTTEMKQALKRQDGQSEKTDEQMKQIEQESWKSQIGQTVDQILELIGEGGKIAQLAKLVSEIGVSVSFDDVRSKSYLLEYGGLIARVDIVIYKT
ncbi:hypothetical protein IKF94_01095 [Candidatus Saccharibacteria bacterium]|nr:hypothetical protein [Candidatus Saccharibacteria bacterium]